MDVAFGRLDPDSGERFQRLRNDLGVSTFGMNLIVLQPRQCGRIHRHEVQEEVFLVLEGELTLGLDGEERGLGVGELVRVGPQVRRQLVNRGTERTVVLALGGSGEHVGRDGLAWESWDDDGPGRPPQEVPLPEDV
jgi:uncharacterized cupin superfamily protein